MSKEANAAESERIWRHLMADGRDVTVKWGQGRIRIARAFYEKLPTDPRCKFCHAPFWRRGRGHLEEGLRQATLEFLDGPVQPIRILCAHLYSWHQDRYELGVRRHPRLHKPGRGHWHRAVHQDRDRFYQAATSVLVKRHALIEKPAGDQVSAAFVPGFVGQDHAAQAIESGGALLKATGHADEEGPWVPVGVGVHTGQAYIGTVGSEQMTDVVILGDAPNVAARLASVAAAGEVVVSADALEASKEDWSGLETRSFELKGKAAGVQAGIIRIGPSQRATGAS